MIALLTKIGKNKGSEFVLGNLSEKLMEEMQCETIFSIGPVDVTEGVVVSWIVMAALTLLAFCMTRGLKVDHISKRQAAVELAVTKLESMITGIPFGIDSLAFPRKQRTIASRHRFRCRDCVCQGGGYRAVTNHSISSRNPPLC